MAKYKLTQKTDANGTTQDLVLDASCIDGVVKSVNNNTPDSNGNVNAGLIYVEGDTTATSPIWTASSSEITSYYTGLTIAFKIGVAGLSGTQTTLNINGLGAKKVFENVSTNPSTHYGVGSILFMAYDTTADSGNGAWRISADRTISDVYVRQYQFGSNAAGTSPKYPILTRYNLTNKNGTYDTAYTRYRTDVTIDTSTGNLDAPTISENGTALSSKYQSALVSGINIKTINGSSVLGSGDLTVSADISSCYPKSGGALNNNAVITMTGSNPYVGLQETGGTQYYLQGYSGEIGISVSGSWGTKRLSLDANGKVFIPSKSIGDGTYTYTLPSKTGTVALLDDVSGATYISDSANGTATTSGDNSCAVGSNSSAVGYSVAIGNTATTTTTNTVAIGYSASATASYGIAIGRESTADGSYGVSIGRGTHARTSGSIAIGNLSQTNTNGGSSICIGWSVLAKHTDCLQIGWNLTSPTDQAVTRIGCANYQYSGRSLLLGAGGVSYTYMNSAGSSWTSASDIRDKTDIQEVEHALDFIKKIHPITYVMNDRDKYLIKDENGIPKLDANGKQYYDVEEHAKGTKKKHRRFIGVSAQETYQALVDCYKDDNYAQIVDNNKYDHPDDENLEQYSVSYERFVPFLIKAIQEQQEQIEELKQLLNK